MPVKKTRQDDARDLATLALYERGLPAAAIAARVGKATQQVAQTIRQIVLEDIRHDPEAQAYWNKT